MCSLTNLRTETVNEFIQRLRPTETSKSLGPWITCVNERVEGVERAPREDSEEEESLKPVQVDLTGGSEPVQVDFSGKSESDDSDSEIGNNKISRGKAILDKLGKDLRDPKGRTKKSLREDAVEALKKVAIECGDTGGKWVIQPTLAEVDEMWAKVAKATIEGRLGNSAKVCTCKEDLLTESSSPKKVICAYMDDFRKIDKVKQMLECLKELEITPTTFKLDLFTSLGIYFGSKAGHGLATGIYTPKSLLEPVVKTRKIPAATGLRKRKPLIDLTNDSD